MWNCIVLPKDQVIFLGRLGNIWEVADSKTVKWKWLFVNGNPGWYCEEIFGPVQMPRFFHGILSKTTILQLNTRAMLKVVMTSYLVPVTYEIGS